MSVLDRILATKRAEVAARKAESPLAELRAIARDAPPVRAFGESLARPRERVAIIAEVKKASPSRGVIREDFDPLVIARAYERGGATALSVLTDEEYFQGSLAALRDVRANVSLPVLRKDFMIDPWQVWEARAAGADAILLILAAIDDDACKALSETAREAGVDVLWEVHDRAELDRALALDPRIVGINNRDLRTFEVRLETTFELARAIPDGVVTVSESGIFTSDHIRELSAGGVRAFLIGESLMRAPDPGSALRDLLDGIRPQA
ncbi:MAG TPA: indole-3-glycerol phosphate synthase TrpC [Planctomycetota bacterium]|nr:indole-3-glycerol phosphate synthase TrpC [Planctomycetota bacterium]